MTSRRHTLAALALGPFVTGVASASTARTATVAAASDLKFALDEVLTGFERQAGERVRVVYGSSGQLFTQILQGAPFGLFLSADEDFVLRLAAAGRSVDEGRVYAIGRIGMLVPQGSVLAADGSLKDLAAALKAGRVRRFAIANPDHAPYGMRAREALQHAGLWSAIQPHLVLGENVSQAAQFATSGAADGGIVALSLARVPELMRRARFDLIDASWHRPLRQRVVLLRDAPPVLRALYEHLATPAAMAVLKAYGFEVAGG